MGYNDERASKSSHGPIINDESVKKFLDQCELPIKSNNVDLDNELILNLPEIKHNPINHVVVVDGGYTEVSVDKKFPSSTMTFFQLGLLTFKLDDLIHLAEKPFISPQDMRKIKEIKRLEFILPTKNIKLKDEETLTSSVRRSLFDFFTTKPSENDNFISTLKWFIFREYANGINSYNLSNCPYCDYRNILLVKSQMKDYQFRCPSCNGKIYLTDVFRLHEAIDDETGAGGISGYLITTLEQIFMVHLIKIILKNNPDLLNNLLFVKDGPLAFFGQTANMYKVMRDLNNYIFANYDLFMVGVEKTGPFPEHANAISHFLPSNSFLLMDNNYIFKYILPGKPNPDRPYGANTYYGNKLIYKSNNHKIYVVTLPTSKNVFNPKKNDFKNIEVILNNLKDLKCDMYENSLLPITLVNQLVSLSDHPSSLILEKFARTIVNDK